MTIFLISRDKKNKNLFQTFWPATTFLPRKNKKELNRKDFFRQKPVRLLISWGLNVSNLWITFLARNQQISVIGKVLALINKIISYARGYPQDWPNEKKVGSTKPEKEKIPPEKHPWDRQIKIL